MPDAPRISLAELRGFISDAGELAKGTQIADGGALQNLARHEHKLFCEAKGSGQAPYRVSLTFGDKAGELKARCSCMAARSRPFCKHSAALLVSWSRSPESFVVSDAAPVSDGPAKKASVKTGKVSTADLMAHGVERVATLVRELAVAGIAAAGIDRAEQVRQLGESLRENRLRRLSARTLELASMLDSAIGRRGHVDAVAYADLLSDMVLTARKLQKHIGGEALENRYVEELIGKTWRKNDRTPVDGIDLAEYAFVARVTADDYVIRESRFVDLATGTHYSEKQILPAFLAKRTEPKRSYARTVLRGAGGGVYPGFAPYRLDLETVPSPAPLGPAEAATIAERAYPGVSAALAAFQEYRRDVFAPDALPLAVRAELVVVEEGRFRIADAAGEALHVPVDPRFDEILSSLLKRGRLLAVIGDMTLDGILATLAPMALVIDTPQGPDLMSVGDSALPPQGRRQAAVDRASTEPAWLDEARRAGVGAAAITLGEVRLQMADALVTGLAGLTARTIDPLASRLVDLGLDKPAALLGEIAGRPDPADRLDGFIKVHQVAGIALVRLAGATTVDMAALERVPPAQSLAIRRPPAVLAPDQLLAARVEGKLSRHEAAWHRSRHIEAMSIDELLSEWHTTWSDGDSSPFIAGTVARAGDRAVAVAADVLGDQAAGLTAQLTAIRVLLSVATPAALAIVRRVGSDPQAQPLIRTRAALAAGTEKQGWRAFVPFAGKSKAPGDDPVERLTAAADKDARLEALAALERNPDERAIPVVRQMWMSDPSRDVHVRAATALGWLGDGESVEGLLSAFRHRTIAARGAKGALAALGCLGDVRAVPEILGALIDNWSAPLPAEALNAMGVPALEAVMAVVASRPDLAERTSLQSFVQRVSVSPQTDRLLAAHLARALAAPDGAAGAAALLKLTSRRNALHESLARQILARVTAPSSKAEKALVRAAKQALEKDAAGGAPS